MIRRDASRGHFPNWDAADVVDHRRQAKTLEMGHRCLRQSQPLEISLSRHPLLGYYEASFHLVEYRYHYVN